MQLPSRIHILGASGSGTTTLAAALSKVHGHRHLDTDDYYWLPTHPPYTAARPRDLRLELLAGEVSRAPSWVLSGSLCGWGDPLIPQFELIVFLLVPQELRLARLQAREVQRYGQAAIAPGGRLHQTHLDFLEWARQYDEGGLGMRSLHLHNTWLSNVPCAVLPLEGDRSVKAQLADIEDYSKEISKER